MSYTGKHTWTIREAITQNKMQNIEDGIDEALGKARANQSSIATLQTDVTGAIETANEAKSSVNNINISMSEIRQGAQNGTKALTLLTGAGVTYSGDNVTKSLNTILGEIRSVGTNNSNAITALLGVIGAAVALGTAISETNIQSLNQRIGHIYAKINAAQDTATSALSQFSDNDIINRLHAIDGSPSSAQMPTRTIQNIITELNNAHTSHALAENGADKKFVTTNAELINGLDNRFEYDEGRIVTNTNAIGNLLTNKINYTDVVADLSTNNNMPLAASQGRELKRIIGGSYTTSNTVADGITNAEQNAKEYADNKLGTGFSTTNTVRKALNDLTTAYTTADTAIGARIDAINTTIGANDTTGIRKRIKDLEDDVNNSTTGLEATKSIADEALTKANAAAVATVVNLALTNLDTRLDALDGGSAIDTSDGTLSARMAAAENSIDNLESSKANTSYVNEQLALKANTSYVNEQLALKANSAAVTEALAGKASLASVNELSTTVNGLLDRDTIVIDKPQNGSNFTNDVPNIPTANIKQNADYLIANDEGKYFYWRYINNEWQQISGGTGSGNGTSSGVIVATLPSVSEGNENTDYFVGNSTNGFLHYRYITNNFELIGADPAFIKRYNVTTSDVVDGENTLKYLDFYEFNYGEDTTLNPDALPINLRIAHILLPLGGGGSGSTATTRFVRIPPTTITTIQNNEPVYIRFFYSCIDSTGESHEATYVLKDLNGVTLRTGTLNSGSENETLNGWPQNKEDGIIYDDGYGSIDVSPYCILGENKFYMTITTELQETLPRNWTVNLLQLRLESDAANSAIISTNDTIDISYIPFGAMQKYLNVKIDNNVPYQEPLASTINGSIQNTTIGPLEHGAHKIEMWLSALINGENKTSNSIIRDYIWYNDSMEPSIIIASPERNRATPLEVSLYSEVEIPYTVYDANDNTINVEYYYDYKESATNTPFDSITLTNSNSGILRYNMNEASALTEETYVPHNVAIKVENEILIINIIVTPLTIDISPVNGAIIDFNPATLTNNSANRLPKWTVNNEEIQLEVSDNFNWSNKWEGEDRDSGGGYREEEDGKCFVIRAGTSITLPYKMFKQNHSLSGGQTSTSSAVFDNGASMKIIFKVGAVRNASAVWFTNMGKYAAGSDKEIGIQLSAHEGFLKTNLASDSGNSATLPPEYLDKVWDKTAGYNIGDIVVYKSIIYECIKTIAAPELGQENAWNKKAWQSLGQLETEISATNSYLYFPYSEEDKIELDININQRGNKEDFIMSYEDGVPSKAYPYNVAAGGDILYQILDEEANIVIGSPDCDVYIYRLRIYNKSLKTNEILKNFIADGDTIDERIKRYQRNAIYYDGDIITDNDEERFTPYPSSSAKLNPIKLAERMKDVKILMLDCPRFTVGKKDFIKNSTLRCLQAVGGKVYPGTLEKDNWYFFNGYHAGQGTTSDNYGLSARNVDFLFECDGTHYPTKSGNLSDFEVGYLSKLLEGNDATVFDTSTSTWVLAKDNLGNPIKSPNVCENWMDDSCKVSLTHFNMETKETTSEDTSIPNNYFNLKTNVASSENVNNALFQKRYNDFLPYESPAKKRDSRIKNDMEFVPAVLFIRENAQDTTTHTEFEDCEWHFYALGNLGDSKKTDYTRAYDPTDMNEFTIEISDNNTSNSLFQSGVYKVNNVDSIETSKVNIDPTEYIYPITSEQWNATRDATAAELAAIKDAGGDNRLPEGKTYSNYRHHTLVAEGFDGDHSFEFRYACRGDYRDGDLINDTSDFSTVPNTDPETSATKPFLTLDDLQFNINRNVWFAFYEWVVTASREQFRAEAAQWFVPSAVEFFYAFTHYYTMMDNRAKNTFWHFGKTGLYRRVSRPVAELSHIYKKAEGTVTIDTEGICTGNFIPIGEFNPNEIYYTQYAFDLWVYDTDTAVGIDNNGELSFPYGREDNDYRNPNLPGSSWAFNGAGSIFWRRLRDSSDNGGFSEEIAALMRKEDDNCFSTALHLINEFDKFQECFPEEIWRLDIERKYIRTFTGNQIDNSITENKKNVRFLRSMMLGRKKYQRRQWIRNLSIYFGSKYGLNNVRTSNHTMEFVLYTPTNPVVTPDWEHLILVPYLDMYVSVSIGNSTTNFHLDTLKRAKAGERVTIDCSSGGNPNETRVYIYGGEHISAIENLAPMYIGANNFELGKRLKVLNLGSDNPNYNNLNLTSLTIGSNMPLLETLNIKNCNRLAGPIDLSESNNLRVVEAEGSAISSITLPNYTAIETLHLPYTVTDVVLNSAYNLNDFYIKNGNQIDYSGLLTLQINASDNSTNINWLDIAADTLDNSIGTLYLLNLNMSSINNINELDAFVSKKRDLENKYDALGNLIVLLILSGNINVTGEWSTTEVNSYKEIWPNLNFTTNDANRVTRYKIVYKYDDGTKDGQEIYTTYITPSLGSTTLKIPEIYNSNSSQSQIDLPTKPETKEEYYVFGTINNEGTYNLYSGWRRVLNNGTKIDLTNANSTIALSTIDSSNIIVVETIFNRNALAYPVEWYLDSNDEEPIYTSQNSNGTIVNILYGGNYNGHIPTVQDIHEAGRDTYKLERNNAYIGYKIFNGWQSAPVNLTLNTGEHAYKIYANWIERGLNALGQVNNTITPEMIASLEELSLEKLFILSHYPDLLSATTEVNGKTEQLYIDTGDRYKCTMGYDGLPDGQELVSVNNPLRITENNRTILDTGIAPFSNTNTDDDAFTLVLDYKFNMNYQEYFSTSREAILAGCYEERSGATYGFRLYYDLGNDSTNNMKCIRVGFGKPSEDPASYSRIIQNGETAQYRNVLVLRHPKNSSQLYIYSGIRYNNGTQVFDNLESDGFEQTLTWNNVTTNANLILGSITAGVMPPSAELALGTIYWAKYWNRDLGAGECRMLAAWPHEQIEFAVEDHAGMNNRVLARINGYNLPNIMLTPMNTSSYIGPVYRTLDEKTYTNGEAINWNGSWYQAFGNQRFFYGLPIGILSILVKTPSILRSLRYNSGAIELQSDTVISEDYIVLPSYSELRKVEGSLNPYNVEANRRYTWVDSGNVTLYEYDSNNLNFNLQPSTANDRYIYMNLRFPHKAIGHNIRIFNNYSSINSIYNLINNSSLDNLRSGDIFIKNTENVAYIYVNANEIIEGAPVMPNVDEFTCGSGGWIRAEYWYTRSIIQNVNAIRYGAFVYVRPNANISTEETAHPEGLSNHNNATDNTIAKSARGACFCYSFGI